MSDTDKTREELVAELATLRKQVADLQGVAAEQPALQDDRARLAAIVELPIYAVVTKTVDGIITSWNSGAERLYGYTAKEMIGQSISILFAPDHFQEYVEIMKTVKKGLPVPSYDTVRRHKDGTAVNVSAGLSLITNEQGEVVEASTISHDITGQKSSEEQLRLLLESTGEGIYGIDMQGRCTFINRAGAAMLGVVPADLVGQEIHALIHHHHSDGSLYPVEECPILRAMQQQSGMHEPDGILWRKDGTSFSVRYSSFPIMMQGTILGAVVTFQDITQTKSLEQQFRQAQKMEAVGQLAGGVAHDFNNLLTVILGYSDIVFDRLPAADPLRDFIDQVRKAGIRAAGLTRQLLAFSRKQILVPEVVDLNTLLNEMEKMLRPMIGEDIDLQFAAAASLGTVKVDRGQTEQVIMNLVVNARDAMPKGGKLTIATADVEIDAAYTKLHPYMPPGPYVLVSVSDTGFGMDQATMNRIFEPFFTTKGPEKGTGLGLSTVYGIVKQSGGSIEVSSEPGKGSTFLIYFPRVGEEVRPKKSRAADLATRRDTGTVLLVEDEAGVRTLIRMILEKDGLTVIEASNGREALLLSQQHTGPIELMATDIIMPDMSGPQIAKQLTALRPDMKVLFLSGYADDVIVRHGFLDEGVPFLEKPFTKDGLLKKVHEVLLHA